MAILFGLITLGLFIGLVLVCISLYRQFIIRSAILENQLLLNRLKESSSQKDYHTFTSLVGHSMAQLRDKLGNVPPRKLEQLIAKEINHLTHPTNFTHMLNSEYSLKFAGTLVIPMIMGLTFGIMMNSIGAKEHTLAPLEAEATNVSASNQDMISFQAYTNGLEATSKLDWETASIELSRVHEDSIYGEEAKEMMKTAKKERVHKESFSQAMSAVTAQRFAAAKEILRRIPLDSLYYQEAQEILNDL